MLDLKMNKLKTTQSVFVSVLIGIMFVTVMPNAYSEYSNRMIPTIDSPYEISMQYQIRDKSQNLVCIVESSVTSFFDSSLTIKYLDSHPNHEMIEKNNRFMNYVLIKDSWRVGEGDSFLSAVKHIVKDVQSENLIPYFFANTNGCAIESGDMVTVYWKVFYL